MLTRSLRWALLASCATALVAPVNGPSFPARTTLTAWHSHVKSDRRVGASCRV